MYTRQQYLNHIAEQERIIRRSEYFNEEHFIGVLENDEVSHIYHALLRDPNGPWTSTNLAYASDLSDADLEALDDSLQGYIDGFKVG